MASGFAAKETEPNAISKFVVKYRENHMFSQVDLGKLMDVSPPYIAQLEAGKYRMPIAFLRGLSKRLKEDEKEELRQAIADAVISDIPNLAKTN